MILGEENEFMANGSNIQYNNDCYSDPYGTRPIKNVDLNNNQVNRNNQQQQSNQHQSNQHQSNQQSNQQQSNSQQFNQQQQANHLNLVQFVDQFSSNFSCNSLVPNLSSNLSNLSNLSNQQQSNNAQLLCQQNGQQSKDLNSTSNLVNLGTSGQIKIKSENMLDAIDLSNNTANLSTSNLSNLSNSSNLPNLSTNDLNSLNLANINHIPLIQSSINLNSINLANCDTTDQNAKCSSMSGNHSSSTTATTNNNNQLPVTLSTNLPVNFNELLLNDYQLNSNQLNQPNQLGCNLINVQANSKHLQSSLDSGNKMNNEMSPIDMEDQEKIKLERKRMRNR